MKPADRMNRSLRDVDPEVYDAIVGETRRQAETLELIASENFTSEAVLQATGELVEDVDDLGERQLVVVGVVLLVAVHALVVAPVGDLEGHGHGPALALGARGEQVGGSAVDLHDGSRRTADEVIAG